MQVRNWIGTQRHRRQFRRRGISPYHGRAWTGPSTPLVSESAAARRKAPSPVLRTDGAFSSTSPYETVICDRSHWEPMYGSVAQARAYATKEDTRVEGPWEFGLMSSVGKRRGLEEAVDCVKAGMALSKVAEEFSWPGCPWPRPDVPAPAAEARRGSFPSVLEAGGGVLWGPPGTGRAVS